MHGACRVDTALRPDVILKVGFGFQTAKAMLCAVELGIFTVLAEGPLDADALADRLGLHPGGAAALLDCLVALRMVRRSGTRYANTPEADLYLDRSKASYIGGVLETANSRLYDEWGALGEALRPGKPHLSPANDPGLQGGSRVEALRSYSGSGMNGGVGSEIARRFPWCAYRSFFDIGAGQGVFAVQVALAHRHLRGGGFGEHTAEGTFTEYVAAHGLADRLCFWPGDLLKDALPAADVLVLGRILCECPTPVKIGLLGKTLAALPNGGAVIIYDAIIDDERRGSTAAPVASLAEFLAATQSPHYTSVQCLSWMREVGFREVRIEALSGADSMMIGIK